MKKPANDIIIELFRSKMGNKTKIAEALNVSRYSLYEWIKKDPALKQEIEQQEESNIDYVESKLFEKINGIGLMKEDKNGEPVLYTLPPSDTAIIFFLKTRAKSRGYIERTESQIEGELLIKVIREGNNPKAT